MSKKRSAEDAQLEFGTTRSGKNFRSQDDSSLLGNKSSSSERGKKRSRDDLDVLEIPNKRQELSPKDLFYKAGDDSKQEVEAVSDFVIRRVVSELLARSESVRDDGIAIELVEQRKKWDVKDELVKLRPAAEDLAVARETFGVFYNYFKTHHNIDKPSINVDSEFFVYVTGFFSDDKDMPRKAIHDFCAYLCEVSVRQSEMNVLLESYPPNTSEYNCLDGNLERIEYLYRGLRVEDKEVALLNAHQEAIRVLVTNLRGSILPTNEIHAAPFLENILGLREKSFIHAQSQISSEFAFNSFSEYPTLFREALKGELSALHSGIDFVGRTIQSTLEDDDISVDEFFFKNKDLERIFKIISGILGKMESVGKSVFEEATKDENYYVFEDDTEKGMAANYDNALASFNDKFKPSLDLICDQLSPNIANIDTSSEEVAQLRAIKDVYKSEEFLPFLRQLVNRPKSDYEFFSGCEALWVMSAEFRGNSAYYLAQVLLDNDDSLERERKITKFGKNLEKVDRILPNQKEKFKTLVSRLVAYQERHSGLGSFYSASTVNNALKDFDLKSVIKVGYPNHITIPSIQAMDLNEISGNISAIIHNNNPLLDSFSKELVSKSGFKDVVMAIYSRLDGARDDVRGDLLILFKSIVQNAALVNKEEDVKFIIDGLSKIDCLGVLSDSLVVHSALHHGNMNLVRYLLGKVDKDKAIGMLSNNSNAEFYDKELLGNPIMSAANKGNWEFLQMLHDQGMFSYQDMLGGVDRISGDSFIHVAARKNSFKFLKDLILAVDNGVRLQDFFYEKNSAGESAIDLLGKDVGILLKMLPLEYLANYQSSTGTTLSFDSCNRNNHHVLSYLLESDLEVNVFSTAAHGVSSFESAVSKDHVESVNIILNHNICNAQELTDLRAFVRGAKETECEFLHKRLLDAAHNGKVNQLKNLIAAGINPRYGQGDLYQKDAVSDFVTNKTFFEEHGLYDRIFQEDGLELCLKSLVQNLVTDLSMDQISFGEVEGQDRINPRLIQEYSQVMCSYNSKFSSYLMEYLVSNPDCDVVIDPLPLILQYETSSRLTLSSPVENNTENKLLTNFMKLYLNDDSEPLKEIESSITNGKIVDNILAKSAIDSGIFELSIVNIKKFVENSYDKNIFECILTAISKEEFNGNRGDYSHAIISSLNKIEDPERKNSFSRLFTFYPCCQDQDFKDSLSVVVGADSFMSPAGTISSSLSGSAVGALFEEEEEEEIDLEEGNAPNSNIENPTGKIVQTGINLFLG